MVKNHFKRDIYVVFINLRDLCKLNLNDFRLALIFFASVSVHKWLHGLRGEGVSRILWQQYNNFLFTAHLKKFASTPTLLKMTTFGTLCSRTSIKRQSFQIWCHPWHLFAAPRLGITELETQIWNSHRYSHCECGSIWGLHYRLNEFRKKGQRYWNR